MIVKVDQNLMELIGYYLAEGSSNKYKRGGDVEFSFGTSNEELELAQKTKGLLKLCFNYDATIHRKKTSFTVGCYKKIIYEFFSQFGKNCYEKKIPSWVVYLPENKILPLLKGAILGDGCNGKYEIKYATVSLPLASQLRLLLFRIGVIHTLNKRDATSIHSSVIKGRKIIARKDIYTIGISGKCAKIFAEKIGMKIYGKNTSGNLGYILDDFILIPIRKIETLNYDGQVFNLNVNENETFCTSSFLIHNCISKHLLAVEGLSEEGTLMTKTPEEREQFLKMAEWARNTRRQLQLGKTI